MIYDYVTTKPPIEEVIEHGWAQNAAAKVHKYLERHRGPDGKWRYVYATRAKSKLQEKMAKLKRFRKGAWNASDEIGRDGTVVKRPGFKKANKSAYERRTATSLSGKAAGSYISGYDKNGKPIYKKGKKKLSGKYKSSASGGTTKKKISTTKVNPNYGRKRRKIKEIGKRKKDYSKYYKEQRQAYYDRTHIR